MKQNFMSKRYISHIPTYMYAVQGGAYFNGTNFYHLYTSNRGYTVFFGKNAPALDCDQSSVHTGHQHNRRPWYHMRADKPEDFMFDSTFLAEALGPFHGIIDDIVKPLGAVAHFRNRHA